MKSYDDEQIAGIVTILKDAIEVLRTGDSGKNNTTPAEMAIMQIREALEVLEDVTT